MTAGAGATLRSMRGRLRAVEETLAAVGPDVEREVDADAGLLDEDRSP